MHFAQGVTQEKLRSSIHYALQTCPQYGNVLGHRVLVYSNGQEGMIHDADVKNNYAIAYRTVSRWRLGPQGLQETGL